MKYLIGDVLLSQSNGIIYIDARVIGYDGTRYTLRYKNGGVGRLWTSENIDQAFILAKYCRTPLWKAMNSDR